MVVDYVMIVSFLSFCWNARARADDELTNRAHARRFPLNVVDVAICGMCACLEAAYTDIYIYIFRYMYLLQFFCKATKKVLHKK